MVDHSAKARRFGPRKAGPGGGNGGDRGRNHGSNRKPMSKGAGAKGAGDPRKNFERYMEMARAAGDPVEAEGYYQRAEYYLRSMNEKAR